MSPSVNANVDYDVIIAAHIQEKRNLNIITNRWHCNCIVKQQKFMDIKSNKTNADDRQGVVMSLISETREASWEFNASYNSVCHTRDNVMTSNTTRQTSSAVRGL